MPLKTKPVCLKCETTESPMWITIELGVVCNECERQMKEDDEKNNLQSKSDNQDDNNESNGSKTENGAVKNLRRSTRNARQYKTRLNPFALPKQIQPKGKGRRVIFKKTPMKAPCSVATPITSESVFYKGSYVQLGDIVSMLDENDDVYYAQIRGLLTDQYCEKSAVVTWLLPTEESPPPEERFDPATYVIGPDEDIPRKLDCMDFVMHAPSDYFKSRNTPYPIVNAVPSPGFIWTSIRPVDKYYTNRKVTKENTENEEEEININESEDSKENIVDDSSTISENKNGNGESANNNQKVENIVLVSEKEIELSDGTSQMELVVEIN